MKHLDLETAKALREAGWDTATAFYWVARVRRYPKGVESWTVEPDYPSPTSLREGSRVQTIACPTTDEIIDVIQDRFTDAVHVSSAADMGAVARLRELAGDKVYKEAIGDTRCQAVARLYIALQST